ncbi:YdcF family protein [Paraglaciecola sp.]|uniref:YdcF family protein n=1 Tax=Paraglaciecola sp. TaxID=1920173 RepID=UPI0030F43547
MLSQIVSVLSSPLVHAPFFYIVIYILGTLSSQKKFFKYLSFIPILWFFLCSMTYPSVVLIKSLENKYPVINVESNEWRDTQAIVVLACNYFEDDELPFVSRWPNCSLQRNLHAVLMYQNYPLPIYLAGDILGDDDLVAQAIHNKQFFEKFGIAAQNIFTISKGKTTETEVSALATILNGKKIALVTSASHLPRAVAYFSNFGIKVVPVPVEHFSRRKIELTIGLPNALSLYRSERAIHEYLGLIYQRFLL